MAFAALDADGQAALKKNLVDLGPQATGLRTERRRRIGLSGSNGRPRVTRMAKLTDKESHLDLPLIISRSSAVPILD